MCFTKYYKNFILCGDIDYHCLLCDENFDEFHDIDKHIRWEKHRKNIKTQTCLPRLKNDEIYRISSYYYCQHCNYVSYNMASIKEHITTQRHISNKTTPEAIQNRVKASYDDENNVIIDKMVIERDYWNGIYDKRCLLCDTNVTDVLKHIVSQDHVIRLIQTEAKYEGEDKCFRKVNGTTFQCFYCMRPFSLEDYEKHWNCHKIDINGNFEEPIRIHCWTKYNNISNLEYDIEQLANITDEHFDIDIKIKQIKCKHCFSAVKPSKSELSNHLYQKHSIYSYKSNILKKITEEIEKRYFYVTHETDAGKIRHELAIFGKENHIKLNAGARKGYCLLCDRYLSPDISIFVEHVQGATHKGHLELKGLIKAKKHKKPTAIMEPFTRYIVMMDYITDFDAVSINFAFCVDKHSFLLMKQIKHGKHLRVTKCLVCEESFKWWKEKEHCETDAHRTYVMGAKMVLADHNFIREIKPKLYHCGMCNVTLPFWETLDKHIKDRGHRYNVTNKALVNSLKNFKDEHGVLPEARRIEPNSINNVFYSNILKVLFESRLCFRIYSMDLQKLQKSKDPVTVQT